MTQDTEQHGSGALVAVGEARSALNYGIGEGLSTHTHTVGVIIPPPDIRAIADKTAQFVAKNGMYFVSLDDDHRKSSLSFCHQL